MTILISRELPLFNFERLDIWCAWIGHPSENLWSFKFLSSFRCSISSFSIYYAPESDFRVKIYDHLNFSRASVVQFRASRHIICPNLTSEWKVMTISISRELSLFNYEHLDILWAWIGPRSEKLWPFELLESFCCLFLECLNISRASHIHPSKSYGCSNFPKASLFNFLRLEILCVRIEHPTEK